ncbi:MAG: gamma-glutamyl-gamma-aminobutyrate hydrolase family protein [Candidatus Latescibacteria bacterium]|nr:gamma-glutamyl-gamma-aminobutyrate hydrolase family protein [Candidatus Latescibacterota bacterium]
MAAPLIGLTTYGVDAHDSIGLPAAYLQAVRRAGGQPMLLDHGDLYTDSALQRLDGLILTGGGDLDPALYGQAPHPTVYMIDTQRDRNELDLARRLVSQGRPTLCICRGLQVLNVALGGSLHQHLPDQSHAVHRIAVPRGPAWHHVDIAANSLLAQTLGRQQLSVPSWHHQAVDRVAPPLSVVAHAQDGTIEALEYPQHPFLLAVQWHPELDAASHPAHQGLFNALITAANNNLQT